jgi:Holliday junction resolvase
MKESEIVQRIKVYLKTVKGCFAWKEHGGQFGVAGIPDIIACIGGRFVAFEVKTDNGKATALQEITIRKIRKAGGIAEVVRSVEDVRRIIEQI